MMNRYVKKMAVATGLMFTVLTGALWAHGNVTPQKVDITGLEPLLGDQWVEQNPYYGNAKAVQIGEGAYAQNCAMCHGMGAVSGGIAPDLRATFADLVENPDEPEGKYEIPDGDELFASRVVNGVVRNGAVYMPAMADKISQEALWSIWAFVSTLCSPDQVDADNDECAEVGDTKLKVKSHLVHLYQK
ncbi:cytochrome c-550 PedF [Thioflexithrix psekupsensis]|uniref:Cytochrome c-550 PedF n=1 Tax=Thioflexithrix psekupsensis TaxID=1570016 RepID=A0A251X422_9GAMM|nr:cytochrome c-550 PedF [Thioflexithrix psekupsensis]OUD12136.1 cytochrome c-550 PedF [Thioflexithrix psekupsensis]